LSAVNTKREKKQLSREKIYEGIERLNRKSRRQWERLVEERGRRGRKIKVGEGHRKMVAQSVLTEARLERKGSAGKKEVKGGGVRKRGRETLSNVVG